ncbi:unnamed protein product [Didymodactylos carnosus]|uniref:Uncharacterized protein n=1 Tax=Didymodactylos carnosus TaxID=1234261 RepID=A0A814T8P8_9BILA|nr:unnamed protein product [Didymodactylos carnosus]CAF1158239.1 unnamed protein product [Didymodactylos carnosus]CAF3665146.1 unnamed protein product [Didymodactylos carnosus]CAF3921637.1 unnamed protein product [Didymodactylos carnosus]
MHHYILFTSYLFISALYLVPVVRCQYGNLCCVTLTAGCCLDFYGRCCPPAVLVENALLAGPFYGGGGWRNDGWNRGDWEHRDHSGFQGDFHGRHGDGGFNYGGGDFHHGDGGFNYGGGDYHHGGGGRGHGGYSG